MNVFTRYKHHIAFVGCMVLLASVMLLDRDTPHDFSVVLFYLVPVWVASMYLNMGVVIFIGIAGVAFQAYDTLHPLHSEMYWWFPYWNSVMEMGTVVIGGYYILKVRFLEQDRKEALELASEAFDAAWKMGGLFPMCPECKQMRTDAEYSEQVRTYLDQGNGLRFIHLTCPSCAKVSEADPPRV